MNHRLQCLIKSIICLSAIVATICATPTDSSATQPACAEECSDSSAGCCCGRPVCIPKTELGDEEKTCWNVECEQVAIPAITLPWEKGGSPLTLFNCLRTIMHPHKAKCSCSKCGGTLGCCDTCHCCSKCCLCGPTRCGMVRCVRKLDEESYEVPKCNTTWEIGCVPCCGNCGHCSNCCTQ